MTEKPLVPPSFDIVRINPDGTGVLAGRGPLTSKVEVIGNGKHLGAINTGEDGSWALVLTAPLPEGALELSLIAHMPDGRKSQSDKVVVVDVPSRKKGGEAVAVMVARNPLASGNKVVVTPPKVLQAFGGGDGGVLVLNAVSYGETGGITLTGRAKPDQSLRLYLDNKVVGEAKADDKGHWQLSPSMPIKPGHYQLRIDALNDQGKVVSRRELPIERAKPEMVAASGAVQNAVIVQPGNSLWRIARRAYGSGVRYVDLYKANKDQIRDPDLIYPGQVLIMPPG